MQDYRNLRKSILCHETSLAAAKNIINDGRMIPSSRGYIGPGVYFAENKQACDLKANAYGCFVISAVNLGRLYEIYIPDNTLTQDKVKQMGYDSVRGYRGKAPEAKAFNTGTEYCVFDPKRITPLFAQINEIGQVYYLFRTNSGVIRINNISNAIVITITENEIIVSDNKLNVYSTLAQHEPLLHGYKLIFTSSGNFEYEKIVQKTS